MQLIPAIDLKGGRCVRLLKGDFDEETSYGIAPLDLLAKYRALGGDWLHVVDLDGARDGIAGNLALIRAMAERTGMKIQVGGGLRSAAAIERMLEFGAARAVVGSAAVSEPRSVQEWLERFGSDRLTLAFDVRLDAGGMPRVATHGWQRQSSVSLWDAMQRFEGCAVKHVLCTDVARDGALGGPNLELYREAARRHPLIEWQASGGIRSAADLHALAKLGVSAAISGKALLDELIPHEDLLPFLPNA